MPLFQLSSHGCNRLVWCSCTSACRVAARPLPVAPALPRAATSRVAGDQGGSGLVAGSASAGAGAGSGAERALGGQVSRYRTRRGERGGGQGRQWGGGEFSPAASPACLPWTDLRKPWKGEAGRQSADTLKTAEIRGFAALSCLPPHPGPVREAVREARCGEGVLPHRLPHCLPRVDLRKHPIRERGRHLPHGPKTPENTQFAR